MNRRKLFGVAGVLPLAAMYPPAAMSEPIKREGAKLLATFDKPITAMTVLRNRLFVATEDTIHEFPLGELK